jgi:hypothetical protein
MTELEPPHRIQKRALPESAPVIAEAARRRMAWVAAMRSVSNSRLTERDRECSGDDLPLDSESTGGYDG